MFTGLHRLACLVSAVAITAPALADPSCADGGLVGTWRLVSAKYGGKDYKIPSTETTLKHVTPAQTLWLTYGKGGRITRAAGGRYSVSGDDYSETPIYGVGKSFDVVKQQTHKFKCRLDAGHWYNDGALNNGLTIQEVWERVDKS